MDEFKEPVIDSSMDLTVMLAQTKSDLHAEIDAIKETDSVVLLIGQRRKSDDGTVGSRVKRVRRNAHFFEAVGIVQEALFAYGRDTED